MVLNGIFSYISYPDFKDKKGNRLDNSVLENFFGLLKSRLLYLKDFKSIEDFQKILTYHIYYGSATLYWTDFLVSL